MSPVHHRVLLHRRNARRLGLAFYLNIIFAAMWIAMLPITLLTGLKGSIPFLAAISVYALFLGHFTGALAALAGKTGSENAAKLHSTDETPSP